MTRTTLGLLAADALIWLVSAIPVGLAGWVFGAWNGVAVTLATWTVSAAVAFLRPVERWLARVLFGAREPTAEERARLEHRLVGVLPVQATSSAGQYAERAHAEIDALLTAGRRPIVVGGTGLYLRAALAVLDLRPPVDPEVRRRWNHELGRRGAPALHAVLAERDPKGAARVAPTDSQRIVRALELLDAGEDVPAQGAGSQLWTTQTRHPTLLAGVTMERAALYARIDERVEAMLAAGAREEVERAAAADASAGARQALGFEELLKGDVERMKRRTRQYAKRQLTWMRKLPGVMLVDATGSAPDALAARLQEELRRRDERGPA